MDTHVHNLSGFLPLIHIAGIPIPVYFLFTSLSFIVGLVYLVRRGETRGFSRNQILDVSLVVMISGFIGSRLFHVFVEEPGYYLARPLLVFDIWSGGFVWYGGAIFASVCGIIFLQMKKQALAPWLDLFAPVGALGYAIGRFACFATGCCFGKIVTLPDSLGGASIRYPTQAFAVCFELLVFALLISVEKTRFRNQAPTWLRQPGQIFLMWLMLHSVGRIVMELFRGDPRGPEPLGFSVATWISLAMFVPASLLFMRFVRASRLREII